MSGNVRDRAASLPYCCVWIGKGPYSRTGVTMKNIIATFSAARIACAAPCRDASRERSRFPLQSFDGNWTGGGQVRLSPGG